MNLPCVAALRRAARATVLALAFSVPAFLSPAAALELARGGRTACVVLLPEHPSPVEVVAAQELAGTFHRVTGARLPIQHEPLDAAPPCVLSVGRTRTVERTGAGLPAGDGEESWRIETTHNGVSLTGSGGRGTLYAVYRFLEDRLGVGWWTPAQTTLPHRHRLRVHPEVREGAPAFSYRELYGMIRPRPFAARRRINGHATRLPAAYGGKITYGPPGHVHNVYRLVPPETYFEEHPEFYAEIAGLRVGTAAQLCWTQKGLVDLLVQRLQGFIQQGEQEAARRGEPPPRLYDVSPNDWKRYCTCATCSELARREGSRAAPLLQAVNQVAERLEADHPDILVDTLAYLHTFTPPKTLRPRRNVVIRLAGFQYRDYAKGALHPDNRVYREAVDGWAAIAPHLRIWDYGVVFGPDGDLPRASLSFLAEDLRYYRSLGIEGIFFQHEWPVTGDMFDLKIYVIARLLENPDLEPEALVRQFVQAHYGPAAPYILDYRHRVARAMARRPSRIRGNSPASDFAYLDVPFFQAGTRLFRRAERAVGNSEVLRRRVALARLAFDGALLARWPELTRAWIASQGHAPFPFDFEQTARRYRRVAFEQARHRLEGGRYEALTAEIAARLDRWRRRAHTPAPATAHP